MNSLFPLHLRPGNSPSYRGFFVSGPQRAGSVAVRLTLELGVGTSSGFIAA